ncbi:hypothetical protein, partial [Schinkia azotoformans]
GMMLSMNEKGHKQHSQINEKGFKIYAKRNYISKDRYLIVLLKDKNDSPPEAGASCPIKCK